LLYRINDEGDQQNKPNIHSTVTLNYETLCHDGRVFATTYRKGIPAEVKVERMIKGWAEGMQLIGKGGKITIWMPANLAYGEDGNRFIGPNEALQMNIELLDVKTPNVQVQSIEWDTPAKDKK
jgi:FKBP-type peptidyl-prolyl cis-trans isomerase